jgi:hypothetical protein
MARGNPSINKDRAIPEFMQPSMRAGISNTPTPMQGTRKIASTGGLVLDANTASQIAYRRSQLKNQGSQLQVSTTKATTTTTEEPIHDAASVTSNQSTIKQRAAGFSADQELGKKDDMSAVLSGLGVVRTPSGNLVGNSNANTTSATSTTASTTATTNLAVNKLHSSLPKSMTHVTATTTACTAG